MSGFPMLARDWFEPEMALVRALSAPVESNPNVAFSRIAAKACESFYATPDTPGAHDVLGEFY
jgi:hypothetical protein